MKMSASTDNITTQQEKGRVIVVGSANHDITTYTKSIPKLGETVIGDSVETSHGGKGANQACQAACLDIADVHMICRIGKDTFGEAVMDNFRTTGVKFNKDKIQIENQSTGLAPILVEKATGDNMIVVVPGANHDLSPSDVNDELMKQKQIASSGNIVVVTQLEIQYEAAKEAMNIGKNQLAAITILNPAPVPPPSERKQIINKEFFKDVDILVPNEVELKALAGVDGGDSMDDDASEAELAIRVMKDLSIRLAMIVTLGARGAMIVSRSDDSEDFQVSHVQAPSDLKCNEEPIEDTVGAGDSFCGSLAAYLSSGLDLIDAAKLSCGVASMSVRKRGAQSSYPRANELPPELQIKLGSSSSTPKPQTITFVTGNKKKLEEVQRLLSKSSSGNTQAEPSYSITNKKIDLPELQGDPFDIAVEKCKLAADEVSGPVLTEDTSLCFNALNGMPGPYIKWFLEKCGHDGLNNMLVGFEDKSGYAQTIVAYTTGPGEEVHVFEGKTDGKIVHPRGSLDFGWDPIFEPLEGKGKTYAEMEKDEKNSISHRGRSFAKLQAFLDKK